MDYKSGRWLAKRQAILSRDKFRCRECRRFGILADASVVHHAYPAGDYPEYAWCDWNLVSLCLGCHNGMHDRDSGALTAKGLAWLRRVSPPIKYRYVLTSEDRRGGEFSDGGKNGGGGYGQVRAEERIHDAPANDAGA